MFKGVLFGGMFLLSATAAISATVVAASSLTERLEGRTKSVVRGPQPGDIVRVDAHRGRPDRLVLLRTAAEELGSPEH